MELGKKIFVIYPGRFHPFHKGHKAVYNYLSSKYGGNDVYITTTDVVELPKSPFSFDEKVKMMTLTGVPVNKIIKVKNNYNLQSLVAQIPIDINRDSIIFAVSEKDMTEDPRFSRFTKKDGSPAYLQPIPKNLAKLQPAITHGYIDTVPTTDFTVLGMPARSASQLRSQYVNLTPQLKKSFVKDLFGKYDDTVYNIMNNKLGVSATGLTETQKKLLKKLIVSILKEDEAKINSAKEKVDKLTADLKNATLDLKNAELVAAEEELKNAESVANSAQSPEEKDQAKLNVQVKKNMVIGKKDSLKNV
jgi:hypothetical protein